MKEQSHKEEMSAALRGDFQRLRERGVPATLVPHEETGAEPEAPPPPDAAGAGDEDGVTADAPGSGRRGRWFRLQAVPTGGRGRRRPSLPGPAGSPAS